MKFAKHKNFDSFLDALPASEEAICTRIRRLILDYFPELKETWAYGAPFYKGRRRGCFLYPSSLPYSGIKEGVNFGFNQAHLLYNEQRVVEPGQSQRAGIHSYFGRKRYQ